MQHLKTELKGIWKQPEPEYYTGDRVKLEGKVYTVAHGTHTHTQLEGLPYAIANWQLKPYRNRTRKSSVISASTPVSTNERSLRESHSLPAEQTTLRSPEVVIPTAKEEKDFKARLPTAAELSHFWKPRSLGTSQAQWSWLNSKAFIKKLLPLSQKIAS